MGSRLVQGKIAPCHPPARLVPGFSAPRQPLALGDWVMTRPQIPVLGQEGSCVTLNTSYEGREIRAVWWEQNGSTIVHRWDEARIDAGFRRQTRLFSKPLGNCSLQLVELCPEDQGTYWVWLQRGCDRDGSPAVQLRVAGNQVPFPPPATSVRKGWLQSWLCPPSPLSVLLGNTRI